MTFQTVIQPSGHSFPIEEHETILEAAIKHGYTLPYSCRDGVCGTCKGKVVTGQVDYGKYQEGTLSDAEKAAGMALFCCAKPLSNLTIECREVNALKDIPVKTMPCRVQKMEKPAPDVMVLSLKLPANERLQFLAGQYIDILLKDQKPRSFSLANAPHNDELLELHIRNITGGAFTHHVFEVMKERDILRFRGPLGTFFLREDSDKPIIFVASGTGFAPIKAIMEHALYIGVKRPMHFYWEAASWRICICWTRPNNGKTAGSNLPRYSLKPCRKMHGKDAPGSCIKRCWMTTAIYRHLRYTLAAHPWSWKLRTATSLPSAGCQTRRSSRTRLRLRQKTNCVSRCAFRRCLALS